MKSQLLIALMSFAMLYSCSKDDDESTNASAPNGIAVSPDAIANALILPTGAQKISGNLPSASSQNAPTFSLSSNSFPLNNGNASLDGSYGNISRRVGGINLQVKGASFYYKVPIKITSASQDSSSGMFSLNLGLLPGLTSEDVKLDMSLYDSQKTDLFSESIGVTIRQIIDQVTSNDFLIFDSNTYRDKKVAQCVSGGVTEGTMITTFGANGNSQYQIDISRDTACEFLTPGNFNVIGWFSARIENEYWVRILESDNQSSMPKEYVVSDSTGSLNITIQNNVLRAVSNNIQYTHFSSMPPVVIDASFDITIPL